jgi:protein arginine kinase activator
MLCTVCKQKEAKVHYSKLEGEKMLKVDLCEECAKQKGFDNPLAYAMADMLMGLGAAQDIEQAAAAEGGELKCPHCGFTQADLKKSGRLGCPECYRAFAEGLEGLLKTMHKSTRHVGKVPEALRQTQDVKDRVKQLQKKLAKAIEGENFEQAAQLRDELKQMSARLPNVKAA